MSQTLNTRKGRLGLFGLSPHMAATHLWPRQKSGEQNWCRSFGEQRRPNELAWRRNCVARQKLRQEANNG